MKRLTFDQRSLVVDDDAADALLGYAAAVAEFDSGDCVTLVGYGPDGADAEAVFVFGVRWLTITDSPATRAPVPDNRLSVRHMRERTDALRAQAHPRPFELDDVEMFDR